MNISKNTEKKLPKTKSNPLKNLPPIDSMDTWGAPVPDFIEKRTWRLKGLLGGCCVLIVFVYALKVNFSRLLKTQVVPQEHLVQTAENETIQLNLNTESTQTELAHYSTNHQQAFLKITPEAVPVLTDKAENSDKEESKETSATIGQQIRTWLHQQHIQGVAYKDFESCIVVNGKIFHLNEVVAPELNLVWSDIDPVAKKLFFYDANGVLYFINY